MKKLRDIFTAFNKKRLQRLKDRFARRAELNAIKTEAYKNSHSLLWVWEFSKKAVLICFIFYVLVQIYAMVVMIYFCDFSYLGELINQTGQILQNCVFAYLIKAGFENVGKIWSQRDTDSDSDDEAVG